MKLPKIDSSWTLFLDRDGVINQRIIDDYVKRVEDFHFISGVESAIALATKTFGKIIVVTNQQGIGKGVMTERNLLDIHSYCSECIVVAGGRIDAFYFAPQLVSENSSMRKPNTGMAQKAQLDFPEINFSKSIMIGDSDSDILFGKNCGMFTVYIGSHSHSSADLTFSSLNECIKTLIV